MNFLDPYKNIMGFQGTFEIGMEKIPVRMLHYGVGGTHALQGKGTERRRNASFEQEEG